MPWSVLIGTEGGVLANYPSYADIEFLDPLYDFGAALIILVGLDGNPAPAQGNVVKIVWDRGLATETTHWEGYVTAAPKKQQGNIYVVRAFTFDGKLHVNQTGVYRNFKTKSPHAIIQAAGSPNPLLVNAQAAAVLTYGTAASVPNKVDGVNPGTVLDQFVADSASLFNNMRRLCMQARYDGASYGLEWTTKLEGANGSDPRFYLVKRRERAAVYTPEIFVIPTDFLNARRGPEQTVGLDAVKVIGAGSGTNRIESALVGAGTREYTAEDKTVFQLTNATNMANRLLDVHASSIDVVTAICYKHQSTTRAGDTITVRQTGVADANLRVMMRHYSLMTRGFTYIVGRPTPVGRDNTLALLAGFKGDTTTPQFTQKSSIAGDEPIAVNGTPTNVTAGNGIFGAWTTIHTFTPAAAFDCDYVDCLLTYYNNALAVHDADLKVRLVLNSTGAPVGSEFSGSARAPAPQPDSSTGNGEDTIAVVSSIIIPVNAVLSAVQYDIQVQAKDVGGAGGFTDAYRLVGKIMKQHTTNVLP